MTYKSQTLEIWQGEYKEIEINLFDENDTAYGSTAGLEFTYRVTTGPEDRSAIIEKTTSGGGITNGTGLATVIIDEADTDDLPPDDYYHELRVEDASNNDTVVMIGTLRIIGSNTL